MYNIIYCFIYLFSIIIYSIFIYCKSVFIVVNIVL